MGSLNGGRRLGPLSPHSKKALLRLRGGPRPRQEFNPGVVDRLCREGLATSIMRDSPYPTRKGQIEHLLITERGLREIKSWGD